MKKVIVILCIMFVTFLSSCNQNENQDFLLRYNLEGMTIYEVIHELEVNNNDFTGLTAVIKTNQLLLSDERGDFVIIMPENEFYISIAPYINNTHPCIYHNMLTCQGDLTNQNLNVIITLNEEQIINGEFTTYDNGFIGFWIPKNEEVEITIEYQHLFGVMHFVSNESASTCVTNMRLD